MKRFASLLFGLLLLVAQAQGAYLLKGSRSLAALDFGPAVSAAVGADPDGGEVDDPTVIATAWSSSGVYYPGAQVTNGGNYYYCLASNRGTATSDTTYWRQLTNFAYFDAVNGNDATGVISSNPATAKASPFKTLNKASDFVLYNGSPDAVDAPRGTALLFNRSNTFTGNLFVNGNDGSNHGRYLIGAYGTGARPVFEFADTSSQATPSAVINPAGPGVSADVGGIIRNIKVDAKNYMIYTITQTAGSAFTAGDVIALAAGGKQATIISARFQSGSNYQVVALHDTLTDIYGNSNAIQTAGAAKTGTIVPSSVTYVRAIQSDRPNWSVWNVELLGTIGNLLAFGYAGDATRGQNITFYNVIAHHGSLGQSAGACLDGGPGSNIKLLHATLYDCGNLTNQVFVHNLYWAGISNTEIAYVWSYMTDAAHGNHCMVFHGVISDMQLHDNVLEGCVSGLGINDGYHWTEAEGFTRVTVWNNTLKNIGVYGGNGVTLDLKCMVDSTVWNNLFINNKSVISLADRTSGAGAFTPSSTSNFEFAYNTITTSSSNNAYAINVSGALLTNARFRNNIIVTNNSNANAHAFRRDSTAPAGEVHLNHNVMWNRTSSSFNVVNWGGTGYTVSSFAGATSEGGFSFQSDPLFTDEAASNFILQATSDAKAAGLFITGLLKDYRGLTRSLTTPTIGAYE